jgi:flagellar M-ring protein FliF
MMQPQPEKAATADGTSAGGQVEAIVGEVIDRPGLPEPVHNEPTAEELRLADARRLAKENPVAVANILKGWISGEAATA